MAGSGYSRIEAPLNGNPSPGPDSALERHYAPDELSAIWNLSADTVRRLFAHEPGVLVVAHVKTKSKRRYRTLRIPESVALRVHRRMTNAVAMPTR